jgi:hypothetical protein
VTPPLRYRIALLAFPREQRRRLADEIVLTLAELDEERGRASHREALALATAGLRARLHDLAAARRLAVAAALLLLGAALCPGSSWVMREPTGDPGVMLAFGPPPGLRVALAAAACVAVAALAGDRRPRWWRVVVLAGGVAAVTSAIVGAAWVRNPASAWSSPGDLGVVAVTASAAATFADALLRSLPAAIAVTTAGAGVLGLAFVTLLIAADPTHVAWSASALSSARPGLGAALALGAVVSAALATAASYQTLHSTPIERP